MSNTLSLPKDFIDLAHQLADAAATVIRQYFRTPVAVDDKADESPVTIADRQAELVMRDLVQATYPDHGIIGEEHGSINQSAEWVWIFDPIDGTKAFITGKPCFGTLICLMHRGEPVLGILNQPITGERWVGVQGQGATLNGAPIQVRPCDDLAKAALYTTDPAMFSGQEIPAFARLSSSVKLRRYGADCYAYGLLAAGFVDLVCEADLKLYDFAALIPIIREAGGIITDWTGAAPCIKTDGRILAAGDARTHAHALDRLREGLGELKAE